MADTFTTNVRFLQQVNGSNVTTWGDKTDDNWDKADAKIAGVTTIAMAGGTTTLTESEERVASIDVSGVLATNGILIFSGRKGTWIIRNRTTGNFTLTAKVSGHPGVAISQGQTALVWSNGTDIASKVESVGRIVGELIPYSGSVAPPSTLLCFGQSINRTTYALLFAAIGTTYGAGLGDGLTFSVPDLRGRSPFGQDDMGGTSANRLTTPINGDVLGAVGGGQTTTLAAANLPAHAHAVSLTAAAASAGTPGGTVGNEATHTHTINPPITGTSFENAHTHTLSDVGDPTYVSAISALPTTQVPSTPNEVDVANGALIYTTNPLTDVTVSTAIAHGHTVDIGSFSSAAGSSHTHSFTGSAMANHTHSVSGNTGNGPGTATAMTILPPLIIINWLIYTGV